MEFMQSVSVILLIMLSCISLAEGSDNALWELDNLKYIGGHEVKLLGRPEIISLSGDSAIQFNGKNDAVLLDTIPPVNSKQFTIEVIFRPDSDGSTEQRFFHIQEDEDHRILMEIRLTENNQWFLDTFIKSGENNRALYAKGFLHPANQWYHAALVYDGEKMRHFVNGKKELEGEIDYVPLKSGKTSIGCRLNQVYWFKGAIQKISVTPNALSPTGFKLRIP